MTVIFKTQTFSFELAQRKYLEPPLEPEVIGICCACGEYVCKGSGEMTAFGMRHYNCSAVLCRRP